MNNSFFLKTEIKNLPNKTGVYLFLDNKKSVIYVGKSVKIRSRVFSYFKGKTKKDKLLVSSFFYINYFLVDSEKDALFLENNLIKTHKPKYNILLKDDKNFPWICVKNERFPRVFITRKKFSDSDFYFGPYVSTKTLNSLFRLIFKLFPIRSCNLYLSEKNVSKKKYNVCLDYHLKKCLGPCEGFQSEIDYNKNIELVKKLLGGEFSFVLKKLEKKIKKYSSLLLFEKAEVLKEQIDALVSIKNRSVVVSKKNINIDCFGVVSIDNYVYINFIRVVDGSVVFLENSVFKNNFVFELSFVLESFIKKIYFNYGFLSDNLISNIKNVSFLGKSIIVPKIGYKKKLLNMSFNNVFNYINNNNIDLSFLKNLKSDLFLKNFPFHIECFDVSTLNGTNTVSSCVVFKNGVLKKNEYVFFKLKNINNDYLSIEESLKIRYKNCDKFPDLIVIDGGKGHLSSAKKAISLYKNKNIDLISIAKKNEIIYINKNKYLNLNKKSSSLVFIKNLRDEAHNFCLKKHRLFRNNYFINSELYNISGIGKKTYLKLIIKYKNIKKIKSLKKAELIDFLGLKKGVIIYNFFNKTVN